MSETVEQAAERERVAAMHEPAGLSDGERADRARAAAALKQAEPAASYGPAGVLGGQKAVAEPAVVDPHLALALEQALRAGAEGADAAVKRARAYAKFLRGGWQATTVSEVRITNPGRNYASAPGVVFDSGPNAGVEAAAQATVTNGEVTGLRMLHGGTGYVVAPLVRLEGGGGEGATAVAVLKDVDA